MEARDPLISTPSPGGSLSHAGDRLHRNGVDWEQGGLREHVSRGVLGEGGWETLLESCDA